MRTIRRAIAISLLFLVIFCCSIGTAATYDFGAANGNGVYSGTLAVDNNGNVAVAIAASTGEFQVIDQVADDTGGAFATQLVNATGENVFVGTGASNANGDTASTGALATGNAMIETIQGAEAGGAGVAAGQATYMEGQTAVAGSLGVSGDGYQASTDTHISNGGAIDTTQEAAAGRILFLGINAVGAVAGQISEIFAGNGGWASSTANGNGNTVTTEASVAGEGVIDTIQVAGAGQVEGGIEYPLEYGDLSDGELESQVGIPEFFADLSVEGAFAGQASYVWSDNGGYTRSSAASADGYQANTGTRYSGTGVIDTIQGAAAGQVESQIGYSELSVDLSFGGAVAGQASSVESNQHATAQSSSNGNGYQAETSAGFEDDGSIDTIQGALAGEIDIFGAASVAGAAAGQYTNITSDSSGLLTPAPYMPDVGSGRGYASSSATTGSAASAETSAEYSGSGYIDTIQGAAAGEIDILSAASVAGAVAGQSSYLGSDASGEAHTLASFNNGYDRVELTSQFSEGGSMDIVQGGAAGRISITDVFNAQGAAAAQYNPTLYSQYAVPISSYEMTASADHGGEHDETDYSDGFQWAVAGLIEFEGEPHSGAEVGPHL